MEKSKKQEEESGEIAENEILTVPQMLKMRTVRLDCLIYFFSCAFELTAGGWFTTYLVNVDHVPMDEAAKLAILFYAGLTFGRFVSGILAKFLNPWKIIFAASGLLLAAVIAFLVAPSVAVKAVLLFFFGFGIGPIFPNMTHLTPHNFGKAKSQSIINIQQAASYMGIMLMPSFFGLLAEYITVALYPIILLVYLALYAIPMLGFAKLLKKNQSLSK